MTGTQATFDFSSPIAHAVEQAPARDRKRLSRQCEEILALLHRGTATNVQLADISLKYTSRVSDLRAAGYDIVCNRLEGGLTEYRLVR